VAVQYPGFQALFAELDGTAFEFLLLGIALTTSLFNDCRKIFFIAFTLAGLLAARLFVS